MKYPTMGQNPRNAVSVPALSGGVNRADALNLVDDNQMTDCKNVWYKDGMLQTRPGIKSFKQHESVYFESYSGLPEYIKNRIELDGVYCKLIVFKSEQYLKILFFPEDFDEENEEFATTPKYTILALETSEEFPSNYVFYNGKQTKQKGKGVYMLATFENGIVKLYELVYDTEYKFEALTSNELYAPVVYINGKGEAYDESIVNEEATYAPASFFEGYNALSGAWARFYFTTDSASNIYRLPIDVRNSVFKVEYTNLNGVTKTTAAFKLEGDTLKISLEDNSVSENANAQVIGGEGQGSMRYDAVSSGLRFRVNNYTNSFMFVKEDGSMVSDIFDNAIGTITNNLTILIKPTNPSKSLLAGATISNEFGGVAEGIYGGTRTFLSGFSGDNKNLLVWSDLNNPTYFSENNYSYIGSNSQSITALAKQDNMLVVFKEKEIYYATYIQGDGYTAEDVLAGKVVDVTTLDARFPVTQINDGIGCDLPNTVCLCGDRLVWASTDNNVYMLRSANQYSNVNVSVISSMLGSNFKLQGILRIFDEVCATTYNGFYLLKSKNKIYLLNFDQYYFNTLPSYSDSKKANRKMQWYVWEIPENTSMISIFVNNKKYPTLLNSCMTRNGNSISYRHYIWRFDSESNKDTIYDDVYKNGNVESTIKSVPIESVIQTKLFDFGAMERFKAIEQMYIEFGKSQGDVEVQYLTERGRLDELRVDITDTAEENSPEFIKTKRLLPGIKRALRFGMRLTAKGQVKLGGILIKFKYMGVTR